MVEIRNKINNKLIGSGVIVEENNDEIKLDKNPKRFKKKNIIIEYKMFLIIIAIVFYNCKSSKEYTNKEKRNIKKVDSIIYENKLMLEIDYKEN